MKYALACVTFFASFAAVYGAFAFVALEVNALQWATEGRVFFVLVAPTVSFFAASGVALIIDAHKDAG